MFFAKMRNHVAPLVIMLVLVAVSAVYALLYFSQSKPSVIKESTQSNLFKSLLMSRGDVDSTVSSQKPIVANTNETIRVTTPEIKPSIKANAVVYQWKQSGNQGVFTEVRTRNNNDWTQWMPIEPIDGGKDGAKKINDASVLVLANKIDEVQFRFKLIGSTSSPSSTINLNESNLTSIDSTDGPSGKPSIVQQLVSYLSPSVNATGISTPRIISRAEWGNPEPNSSGAWTPEYHPLQRAIIHHTATTESSDSYADVRAIWQYHAKNLGWEDIGYNYIVDSHGNIFQGRYFHQDYALKNRVDVVGGHAYNNNIGTTGVSIIGNYQSSQPSAASLDSVSKIVGYKLAKYQIDPTGSAGIGEAVVGHYFVSATSCPGVNVINKLDQIRSNAQTYFNSFRYSFFNPLDNPRWMRMNSAAYKFDLTTMERKTDNLLLKNQQIKFIDKILIDGKWYFRTEYDSNANNILGVPQDETEEIPYEPLPSPIWKTLLKDGNKSYPSSRTYATQLAAGTSIKFTQKISINGTEYYRTSFDADNGNEQGVISSQLSDFQFIPLLVPTYMHATTTTQKMDVRTSTPLLSVSPAQPLMFSGKTLINGVWYYQTSEDSAQRNALGFDSRNISRYAPSQLIKPTSITIPKPMSKVDLHTLQAIAASRLTEGQRIDIAQSILIGNELFFITKNDRTFGNYQGIKVSDLLVPLDVPRNFTVINDARQIKLSDMTYANLLAKDTTLYFSTKILLNDRWCLRSQSSIQSLSYTCTPLEQLR